MKLLTRNEKSSFIAGASVEPDTSTIDSQKSTRRYDLASSWRRSEDGNFDGYEEKRSEIKVKSQHAFHVAITIGEFIELVSYCLYCIWILDSALFDLINFFRVYERYVVDIAPT